MKKLSNFHRKVLNIVVTLMAAIALMLGNVTSVAAYTDLNGYPLVWDNPGSNLYVYDSNWNYITNYNTNAMSLKEQNAYFIDYDVNFPISDVREIRVGTTNESIVFPINLDAFDYYLVGTVASVGTSSEQFGDITNINIHSYDTAGNLAYVTSMGSIGQTKFFNSAVGGRSFYCKINLSDVCNVGVLDIITNGSTICGDLWFSASVVPVSKSGTESDTLNSILQKLTEINQNIITGNTLQQQTIDAINQNTTNTSNWFTTLITTLQGWFNTQTENLRTWFYMIEERMSAGFTALYHQMTREQDEKLNGYTDTTQSDAADSFNTESDKLTELEDQLNDQSHDFVSDYTTSGFNTGVLTTLSSSIIFVTTWFANFWNMGGMFTSGLNFCFSLSIVFFILRFRR